MGSLASSGVAVVSKQLVAFRSYGRNIAVTSGANVHAQDSVRAPIVQGIPTIERPSGLFGTQSTPATESFLHMERFVKHAESVDDTTTARILGQVAATTGLVPENAQQWGKHQGNRIIVKESIDDGILGRRRNDSVRPGGEI